MKDGKYLIERKEHMQCETRHINLNTNAHNALLFFSYCTSVALLYGISSYTILYAWCLFLSDETKVGWIQFWVESFDSSRNWVWKPFETILFQFSTYYCSSVLNHFVEKFSEPTTRRFLKRKVSKYKYQAQCAQWKRACNGIKF